MTDAVEYADEFPDPRTFCPSTDSLASTRVEPALVVAVFVVQTLFVVTLLMIGVGVPIAALLAVGVLLVDMLILTARPPGLSMLLSALVSVLASVPPTVAGVLTPGELRCSSPEGRRAA